MSPMTLKEIQRSGRVDLLDRRADLYELSDANGGTDEAIEQEIDMINQELLERDYDMDFDEFGGEG